MNEQKYTDTYKADIYEEEKRLIKEAENSNRLSYICRSWYFDSFWHAVVV